MGDSDLETMANVTKAEYDFDDESFDVISQTAKKFISKLLLKDKKWVHFIWEVTNWIVINIILLIFPSNALDDQQTIDSRQGIETPLAQGTQASSPS